MSGTALSFTPADRTIVAEDAEINVSYRFTPGVADVEIAVWANGDTIALYTGGSLSPLIGYSGDVTVQGDRIDIHLTKDTPWTINTPIEWYSTYEDADKPLLTEATRYFIYAQVAPNTIVPSDTDDLISLRPTLYLSFDFSLGTGVGVDLTIDGHAAQYPAYTITEGGSSTRAYVQATPRRAFTEGVRVTVVAAPKVTYSGVTYHGVYMTYFTPQTIYSPQYVNTPFSIPFTHPLGETLRRLALDHLVLSAQSPGLRAVLVWLLYHSNVGALVRSTFQEESLRSADIPGETALTQFVQAALPVWHGALNALAPAESQETLEEVWASGHTIERAACLGVLVAYASGQVS